MERRERGNLPAHIQTVAVPIFVNRTSEPAVENVVAQAVVQAFSTSGRLRVVRPRGQEGVEEQSEFWAGPPKGHDHHRVLEDG